MEVLKHETKSLCPECFKEISAKIIEKQGKAYMLKECPKHGRFSILLEKDAKFYRLVMNSDFEKDHVFNKIDLPVSFSCNLNCNICYAPQRNIQEIPSDELKDLIKHFNGTYISLAGGEPTMREDLLDIIKFSIKNKKIPVLVTNGLKLTDIGYVKRLEKSGLRLVNFSFNGFNDKVYERINGKKILKTKLDALNNLKQTKMLTGISMMLERGLNEQEVQKALDYCLSNNPQIYELRIKSSNIVGKHISSKVYHTSELLDILCKTLNIDKHGLYNQLDRQNTAHSVCRFSLDLYYYKNKKSNSLLFVDVNVKGKNNKKDSLPVRVARIRHALDFARRLKIDSLYTYAVLLKNLSLKKYVQTLAEVLTQGGKLIKLRVEIRSWPNKYSIDLMENTYCPVLRLNENKEKLPFCYSLLINEKARK